jgi:hypothetical protein
MELIIEALGVYWGDRCPHENANCRTCRAWAEFDGLVDSHNDLRELAARYDALMMHLNTVLAERDAALVRQEAVHD